jgi:hypothetical protein
MSISSISPGDDINPGLLAKALGFAAHDHDGVETFTLTSQTIKFEFQEFSRDCTSTTTHGYRKLNPQAVIELASEWLETKQIKKWTSVTAEGKRTWTQEEHYAKFVAAVVYIEKIDPSGIWFETPWSKIPELCKFAFLILVYYLPSSIIYF